LTWEEAVRWLLSQPDKQELVRACYFDDPLIDAAERYYQSEEWKAITHLLHDRLPGKVLDIGAGRGISSYAFAKHGCKVTALEPDNSQLVGIGAIKELSRMAGLSIRSVSAQAESLPLKENCIDIVYGRAVLHHAKDIDSFCRSAARVLKPGGTFLATREHVISYSADLGTFLASHPLHALYGGEHAYTLGVYSKAIRNAGLKLLKIMGPYENVVNYAPVSHAQHRQHRISILKKYMGRKAAVFFMNIPSLAHLMDIYLSRTCNTPGRLYSFLAVKP
jgi:ubiquinone/menaquinone biosynthesis C-methylase UbiE